MEKIHTTIGIYPNGDFKTNGVADKHLQDHIEYNKKFRFGRALIVDNEVVYKGYVNEETIKEVLQKVTWKHETCTAPYH